MTVQACAVCAQLASHLLVERDAQSKIGLHGSMQHRPTHRTMESFFTVDGRSELHSRHEGVSEKNRNFFSDPAHLGLDPTYPYLIQCHFLPQVGY